MSLIPIPGIFWHDGMSSNGMSSSGAILLVSEVGIAGTNQRMKASG